MAADGFSKFKWLELLRGAELTHAEYRVLTMIAGYSGADGRNAFPGSEQLAANCRIDVRSVKRITSRLVTKEWLTVTSAGGGRGRAAVYALSVPTLTVTAGSPLVEPQPGRNGDPEDANGDPGVHETVTAGSPHQVSDQVKASGSQRHVLDAGAASARAASTPALVADDEFDRFWVAYPRKVGKQPARKAWRAARRKVDLDAIRYALGASLRAWQAGGTPPDKIPHPTTWLNREPWHDDPAAIAPVSAEPTSAFHREREAIFAAAEARGALQESGQRRPGIVSRRQQERDAALAAAFAEAAAFDAATAAREVSA